MSLHKPKPPSMWKEGDRLRWRIENSLTHKNSLHTRSHPCTALPINCSTLHYPANQPDPPAITHHYRGPPSFSERGLLRYISLHPLFYMLRNIHTYSIKLSSNFQV